MTRRTRIFATLACLFVPALAVAQLEGLNVFTAGDVISSSQVNENFDLLKAEVEQLQDRLAAVEAHHIGASVEIAVSSCEQLNSELEALASKTIAPSAVVTYTIAAGQHDCDMIEPRHPNGSSITIRGAGPSAADTVLNFVSHGILLEHRAVLGNLATLTLVGPGDAESGTKFDGVRVLDGSMNLNDVVIRKFRDGINGFFSSTILATGVTAELNQRTGFHAEDGATLQLSDTVASDNATNGYEATRRGIITLSTVSGAEVAATASGNGGYGYRAASGGLIYGYQPLGEDSNADGFVLPDFDVLSADGSLTHH